MNTPNEAIYSWPSFYMELADKLLAYRNDRGNLLALLETAHRQTGIRYPFVEQGQKIDDICPFTVFADFNKGLKTESRIALLKAIGEALQVQAAIPTALDGVPVMNNMHAWFFGYRSEQQTKDIDHLWNLFESAIQNADQPTNDHRETFIKWYNIVMKQPFIKWNLTMGLFWIRPYKYMNLDSRNRDLMLMLKSNGKIDFSKITDLKQPPEAEKYLTLIDLFKDHFITNQTDYHSFPELSEAAWVLAVNDPRDGQMSNASFLKWFAPLISALKELGGSATPEEARKQIIKDKNLSEQTVNETRGKLGLKKFNNEVAWARAYLAAEGMIDNSQRGLWTLTQLGMQTRMTDSLASQIKFRWQSKKKEDELLEEASDISAERRFWIYSPGKTAMMWDEFRAKEIMGIEWDKLGDLTQYESREAMRSKLKEVYTKPGEETKSYQNDSLATWQFASVMNIGDIVYVKKGLFTLVGRGIVESEYIYAPERNEYQSIRKVKWTHVGTWSHPGQAVAKTLTDISPYTEYVQKLEDIFVGTEDERDDEPGPEISYKEYSALDFLNDVFIDPDQYEEIVSLLKNKKNLILQGAPGVGKTYAAKRLAYSMIGAKDTSRVMMVQFHQSYSYEDFIMGFRPAKEGFELTSGPFYQFCKKAADDEERDYFFIIDEINRGNLSKIFGELLMLIESDKRGEKLRLLYSNELFSVPKNLYLIGLMNTADRSIAMIDYALRRRFAFYELEPAFDSDGFTAYVGLTGNLKFPALVERVRQLNEVIRMDESLGAGFRIGHSFFCTNVPVTDEWLNAVVKFELLPLISEYWFENQEKVDEWTRKLLEALND